MWVIVVFFSILYTELIGYVVHRWLHTQQWWPWIRDLHMEHHLEHYPPGQPMISEKYKAADRKSWLEKVGWEWIIPIATVTLPLSILLVLLGAEVQHIVAGYMLSLAWTWLMFDYMHNAFHKRGVWLEGNYITKGWFKETRKLHFIHHNDMTKNFGIAFFWFDKIYETFTRKHKADNAS